MGSTPLARSVCLAAGAFLTLLALGLIAPSRAEAAGCGHPHHVTTAAVPGPHDSGRLDLLSELGTVPGESSEMPDLPAPCSGPNCSKGKGVPIAPPPPPPPRVDAWGLLELDRPAESPAPLDLVAHGDDPRPIHRAESLFHPPR